VAEQVWLQATLPENGPQGNDCAAVKGVGNVIRSFVGLQSELAIRKLYAGSINCAEAIAAYTEYGFELSALGPE
jgi:hypothetical protein